VVFIDDVNMPAKNKYGAQPPIELLRQLLDSKGWYDLDSREFKYMCGAVLIAAMTVTPGLQNSSTARFIRHFVLFYVEAFEEDSLLRIFTNVLEWLVHRMPLKFDPEILALREMTVRASIELFNSIKTSKNLLPTPAKSHYIFNLRDMGKIFLCIAKVSPKITRTKDDFIRFWMHECLRVFQDRMVNEEDSHYFMDMLNNISYKYFGKGYESLVTNDHLLFSPLPSNPINPFANNDENYREEFNYAEVKDIRGLLYNMEESLNR
jgi:dynein heavy chain, axonemal